MRIKRNGISSVEDMVDLDGIIKIALMVYADGERNPRLNAVVAWIKTTPHPTAAQFIAFMESIGAQFIPADAENIDN